MPDDWEAQAIAQSTPFAQGAGKQGDDWEAQAIAQSTPFNQSSAQPDVSVAQDVGVGALTGLGKGAASLLGQPVDVLNWVRNNATNEDPKVLDAFKNGVNTKGEPLGQNPDQDKADMAALHSAAMPKPTQIPGGTQDITNFVFPNGAPYQPQTGPGKFAETAGEILPAVATGTEFRTPGALSDGLWSATKAIGGDARRILLPTLAAAGGGEAADAVGLPKVAGEIPAMLLQRAPSMFLDNAGRMVKDRLGDLSDADIEAARALQAKGQSVGVPLMGQESFDNLGLTQLAGDVAASPTGSPILNSFLTDRTPQVQAARSNMLDAIGPDIGPQQAGDIVNQAADQRLRDLAQMRTNAATPGYQAAASASIPDVETQRLEASARAAADQAGAGTLAKTRLNSLADAIAANGSNIGLLDSTRKTFRDNLSNAALPDAGDSELRVLMNPILNDMRDTMVAHNPDFAAGLQAYRDASPIVDQVERSPVGQVMAKNSEPTAITGAIGPTRMNGPEVRDAFNELALANPQAPAAATRMFARNETNFDATPTAAQKIASALMGKPDTAENFQAMMRGSEFAGGQAPGTISGPVNDTLDVFDATRRAPRIGSQTAGRTETNKQAGSTAFGSLLETPITEPFQRIGDWLKYNTQRRTYADLARALSSPTSVDDLLAMARQAGITPQQRALLSTMALGGQGAIDAQQPNNR